MTHMPRCVKCRQGKRNKLVCLACYNRAIEDLTTILEETQTQLNVVTVQLEFLRAVNRSAEKRSQAKKTSVIDLPESASIKNITEPKSATG